MDQHKKPIDAVDLEVIKASLSGIVQEMRNSLFRTGISTIAILGNNAKNKCYSNHSLDETTSTHGTPARKSPSGQ
jgi:hypothetical protein